MFFFHQAHRTIRLGGLNPTSILRHNLAQSKPLPSDFYSSSPLQRIGLRCRSSHRKVPVTLPARNPFTAKKNRYERDETVMKLVQDADTDTVRVIWGIIGINTSIWVYSLYVRKQAEEGFPQRFHSFYTNMTLNPSDVLQGGRYWQLITSVFTHTNFLHLLSNMVSTYYLGNLLVETPWFTPGRLVALVLGSGLTGSLGYMVSRTQLSRDSGPDIMRGLGFSGAVMGLGTVGAILYPKTQLLLYGIVPMPLWALIGGYALYDGYYVNDKSSRVAHSGHLGGLLFGALFYLVKMRGLR